MDESQVKITGTLLEVKADSYQGNDYMNCKLRSKEVADNTILKYKVDINKVKFSDLEDRLDSEVTLVCDVVRGDRDSATLKVVGVEA